MNHTRSTSTSPVALISPVYPASRRMRAVEKPRPSRNFGKSISTSFTRLSAGIRCSTSSPASNSTETASSCSRNASSDTAGSSATASSRKRSVSAIDRLLERLHSDPPVGVEEAFAIRALAQIDVGCLLDGVDHAVLVEAGAGDLGLGGVLVTRAAEEQLVGLAAFLIDAEDADVACVVMPAGIDAAADLDLELAEFALAVEIGEALRDLLCDRDRARVGEAAVIEPRTRDDVGHQVEIDVGEVGFDQRLPYRVEVGLLHVRQHQVLHVAHAQLVEAVALGEVGHDIHLVGGLVVVVCVDLLQADVGDRFVWCFVCCCL